MTIFDIQPKSSCKTILVGLLILFLTVSPLSTQWLIPGANDETAGPLSAKDGSSSAALEIVSPSPDFSMSITPSIIRHVLGQSESSTILLTSLNGFSGVVALSAIGNLSFPLSFGPEPRNLELSTGSTASSSVFVYPLLPGGIYTGLILATSGALAHSVSLIIIVRPSLVCLAPDGAMSCDETPSLITGPSAASPSQLRVAVVLGGWSTGVQDVNGFDITLLANHSILRPAGFDLTGTILPATPTVLVDCIGGVSKNGGHCVATDTVDTIHVAAVGGFPQGSIFPGLLFTAIYNVTGTTPGTPIGFQTGCSHSSVFPDTCVAIANGSVNLVREDVQGAQYSNLPAFAMDVSPALLVIERGSNDISVLTITGVNGFGGNVTVFPHLSPSGPMVSLSPTSVLLTSDSPTGLSSLTVTVRNETSPGIYNITITGTSGQLSASVTLLLDVPQPDFIILPTSNGLVVNAGEATKSSMILASTDSFAGRVSLTLASSLGLDSSLSNTTLMLQKGGVVGVTLITTPEVQGILQTNVTATSSDLSHEITVIVLVRGFSLSPALESNALTLLAGSTGEVQVDANGFLHFNGTVALTEFVTPATGLSVSCNPSSLIINSPFVSGTFCSMLGSTPGDYTVTITGSTGLLSQSFKLSVFVVESPPVVVQFHWKHRVSLSKSDNTTLLIVGVHNPNNSTTVFAIVRLFIYNPSSPVTVTAHSNLLTLPPLATVLNIPLSVALVIHNPSFPNVTIQDTGVLKFRVEIDWWSGTTGGQLPLISQAAEQGVHTTGTLTVVP